MRIRLFIIGLMLCVLCCGCGISSDIIKGAIATQTISEEESIPHTTEVHIIDVPATVKYLHDDTFMVLTQFGAIIDCINNSKVDCKVEDRIVMSGYYSKDQRGLFIIDNIVFGWPEVVDDEDVEV